MKDVIEMVREVGALSKQPIAGRYDCIIFTPDQLEAFRLACREELLEELRAQEPSLYEWFDGKDNGILRYKQDYLQHVHCYQDIKWKFHYTLPEKRNE